MKALLLLIAALTFGFGETPTQPKNLPDDPMVVEYPALLEAWEFRLFHRPVETEFISTEDRFYVAPTVQDIEHLLRFYREHRSWDSYVPESWDCDNFAREFLYLSQVWGRKEWPGLQAQITVAAAYVEIAGDVTDIFPRAGHELVQGYHVMGLVFCANGDIYWFEPQTQLLVPVEGMLYEGSLRILRIEM